MVRRLTAIMFTDMVGYTALMQEDERQAMANRKRQRQVLEDSISRHGGKILQFYGDGTLSVFDSAVAAVRSAVEVQEALRTDPPVPLRIGVHTGDVVHDDDGVFGDGVNVAARVQGLAVPGGILISGKVFDEVKNQGDIQTRGLGAFDLKHVKQSMRVFAIANDGLAVPEESDLVDHRPGRGKSVAVLPFVNMSTDPENEFFSDGITEEIINALTRINGLQVTARTSTFAFKNKNEDVRTIAEQLGVTHVLEGSVRRAGNLVRVTAQLICAKDGYHLFSRNYDSTMEDIFAVQDEISSSIVEALADHLGQVPTSEEERPMVTAHSHDTEAYAEYLRGRFEWARFTPDGSRRAINHYDRSVEMDPDCALPYSGLAAAYVFLGAVGHMPGTDAFSRAEEAALKALELEPDAGESHVALAAVKLFYHWDFDGAYHSFQRALSLAPGSAEAHHLYAMYLESVGEYEESVDHMRTAVRLDPLSVPYHQSLAQALLSADSLEEAEREVKLAIEMDPAFRSAFETLGWIHAARGDYELALREFNRIPDQAGHKFAAAAIRGYAYGKMGRLDDWQAMHDLLEERKIAHPDVSLEVDFALVHLALGDYDRVFEYLNRAYEARLGTMVFIRANFRWAELRGDPRFDDLVERIGARETLEGVA